MSLIIIITEFSVSNVNFVVVVGKILKITRNEFILCMKYVIYESITR